MKNALIFLYFASLNVISHIRHFSLAIGGSFADTQDDFQGADRQGQRYTRNKSAKQ